MEKKTLDRAILAFGGNVTNDTINNLSADTINNLSADTINNLSAYTINNLSAYTINNLSADTINNLSDKATAALKGIWDAVPDVVAPYTTLSNDLKGKRRVHNQSDWGPDCDPETNLCGTSMCTAGHLVNLGGAKGYALKNKFGWATAAGLIHMKAHPDAPTQNFGNINQAHALAYIEMMAEFEQRKSKKQTFANWIKAQTK